VSLSGLSSCRQDFVSAYVDHVFDASVAALFECFHAGFHKVCGGKVLELFQPNELQAMVIGNTDYDWTELEKVSKQHRWRPAGSDLWKLHFHTFENLKSGSVNRYWVPQNVMK